MPDYGSQLEQVIRFVDGKKISKDSPIWQKCLEWVQSFNTTGLPPGTLARLIGTVCNAFDTTEEEIYHTISGVPLPTPKSREEELGEEELVKILPKGGWFEWYWRYTLRTESPLSYHIFSSLCTLGAAVARHCYIDMGFYRLFPNYNVVLVGPPGRVKKTSAVNIAKDFIHTCSLCPIMADKITPEAMAKSLMEHGGHQFIYAPEFSILFGKQRYNEGLTTFFLRILDCPDTWTVNTLARGEEELTNLVPIILGGSTLSLLASATPGEVTSSGFLSRFVMVVENDTQRSFPVPEKGPLQLYKDLLRTVERVKAHTGEIKFSGAGRTFYNDWYNSRRERMRKEYDPTTAETLERMPDHFLRTAALAHLALHDTHEMCVDCLRFAGAMLAYVERRIPQTISAIGRVVSSQDTDYLLEALRRMGGTSDHSKLLRRVSSRIDATSFKRHMGTLIESKLVLEEKRGPLRYYILLGAPEGGI